MAFRDGFTRTNVALTMEGDDIVVEPVGSDAAEILEQVLAGAPDTLLWKFGGSHYANPLTKDRLLGMDFFCGGVSYRRREGNVTYTDYRGGLKIHLDLETVQDATVRGRLLSYGYYGGLRVKEGSTASRMQLGFAVQCKECNGPLARSIEVQRRVCDDCALRCQHQYIQGAGTANGCLALLRYCELCGRADPTWVPADDPAEDLVRLVEAGIVNAVLLVDGEGASCLITT